VIRERRAAVRGAGETCSSMLLTGDTSITIH